MKLVDQRDGIPVTGLNRCAKTFRNLPKSIERGIAWEWTWRHRDLLARIERAGGLWSAASGEEAACLGYCRRSGGLGPFRGLEAPPRASIKM